MHDVTVSFRRTTKKFSCFVLCLLSPIWREMMCKGTEVEPNQILDLQGNDEKIFSQLVELGCGGKVLVDGGLQALVKLGMMADQYQVETVLSTVEHAVQSRLTIENCASVWLMTCESGLERLKVASRALALREFDAFAMTDGFMHLTEELLGSLLEDDMLRSQSEERVFEMVMRWIRGTGSEGTVRGEGLLRKVRFPFMAASYLENCAAPQQAMEGLGALAAEALKLKSLDCPPWCSALSARLEASALAPRRGGGVSWESYLQGGGLRVLRLPSVGVRVGCIALHGSNSKFVCAGLYNGLIHVWCRSTFKQHTILRGHRGGVWALTSVGEWLVSGSRDNDIRVWDCGVTPGRVRKCERVLQGHRGLIIALAVCGGRLVSGSWDRTVRVWRVEGPVSAWVCELTLSEHYATCNCLALWGGRLVSGSTCGTITVWDLATGSMDKTMEGHVSSVTAMVSAKGQSPGLISSSMDGAVKVWSMVTRKCVRTEQVYAAERELWISWLDVSGSTLVGVSRGPVPLDSEEYTAHVWDLATLAPLHKLKQPAGMYMDCMVAHGLEVWFACRNQVIVWGRSSDVQCVGKPSPKEHQKVERFYEWLRLSWVGLF